VYDLFEPALKMTAVSASDTAARVCQHTHCAINVEGAIFISTAVRNSNNCILLTAPK